MNVPNIALTENPNLVKQIEDFFIDQYEYFE